MVGARVAVTARKPDAAAAVASAINDAGGEAVAIRCDVTSSADIDNAIARNRRSVRRAARCRAQRDQQQLEPARPVRRRHRRRTGTTKSQSRCGTAYHLAQASFAHLLAARGSFVFMLSTAGMEGSPPVPAYSTIKGADSAH